MADTKINPHYQSVVDRALLGKFSKEARALANRLVAVLKEAGLNVASLGSIGITLNTDEKGWKILVLNSSPAKDPAEELLENLGFSHTRDEEQNTSTGTDIV